MCEECHGNESICATARGTISEPEATSSVLHAIADAEDALNEGRRDQAPVLAPALNFYHPDQLQIGASLTSRTDVEPSAGASRECAENLPGYSDITYPADAPGADNHGRITIDNDR
ncbi:MAG: hypothetical protein NT167_28445, partial [Verrucomicrobia bacterium]|nr:hypothetical protein [Verrucomicrobiota bacterium]